MEVPSVFKLVTNNRLLTFGWSSELKTRSSKGLIFLVVQTSLVTYQFPSLIGHSFPSRTK